MVEDPQSLVKKTLRNQEIEYNMIKNQRRTSNHDYYLLALMLLNTKQDWFFQQYEIYLNRFLLELEQNEPRRVTFDTIAPLTYLIEYLNTFEFQIPELDLLNTTHQVVLKLVITRISLCLNNLKTQSKADYCEPLYPSPSSCDATLQSAVKLLHKRIRHLHQLGMELIAHFRADKTLSDKALSILMRWEKAFSAKKLQPLREYLPPAEVKNTLQPRTHYLNQFQDSYPIISLSDIESSSFEFKELPSDGSNGFNLSF